MNIRLSFSTILLCLMSFALNAQVSFKGKVNGTDTKGVLVITTIQIKDTALGTTSYIDSIDQYSCIIKVHAANQVSLLNSL
jgi:hypothetical protein